MKIEHLDKQNLVNSSVNISRAVFEMNKPGRRIYPGESKEVDLKYILAEVEQAIKSLETVRMKLTGEIKIKFDG